MIDAITSPGMAIDIRLSTLESVQQLGPRLAQVLSGELSRMRADIAFASATGIAVHSARADADSLRAQQSTLLGHHSLSLTTRTAMHSEAAQRLRTEQEALHQRDDGEHGEWVDEEENPQHQSREQNESESDNDSDNDQHWHEYWQNRNHSHSCNQGGSDTQASAEGFTESDSTQDALVKALQNALTKFYDIVRESGITGVPIAVVLPADHWLEQYAPASLRYASKHNDENLSDNVLVLCLGFDGDLALEQTVWGFVYQHAECVGSAQGRWFTDAAIDPADSWQVNVADPEEPLSVVSYQQEGDSNSGEQHSGLRICIDGHVSYRSNWSWQLMTWTWH